MTSRSVMLVKDSAGTALTELQATASGELKVSSSGGGGGDATAANQSLQLAQETIIAGDTTSLDSKITQGSDVTLTNAQQVLCYGRDTGGALDALRTDSSGHLEITIDDFVKGQATMANSFPVVIASDQAATNFGSTGNLVNNGTLSSGGGTSSEVDVSSMNVGNLVYEDATTASFDGVVVEVSLNGQDFFRATEGFPFVSGGVRIAYQNINLHGIAELRIKNSSGSAYTSVTASIVGAS